MEVSSISASLRTSGIHELVGLISCTLAHVRDDMSYARNNQPEDNYCLTCDYGNADFDIRHTLSAYALYDIPNFLPSLPRLGKGWQLNTIFIAHTGTPFSVAAGQNISNSFGGGDRADKVGDPFSGVVLPSNKFGNWANGFRWFNAAAFSLPKPGTYGNTAGTSFMDQGSMERISAQFRVEIFNLFNRLNLSGPDTCVCSGTGMGLSFATVQAYGSPGIGAGEPRNVQLALKVIW